MKTSDFSYQLPQELIAQKPHSPRDASRLMTLNRSSETLSHKKFYELSNFLRKGDVLVFNNSKVIPARLIGSKEKTGGAVEIFLVEKLSSKKWKVIIKGKRIHEKMRIVFSDTFSCSITKELKETEHPKIWEVSFSGEGNIDKLLNSHGEVPTPPYIKTKGKSKKLWNQYQTVYAKTPGSVAAPTAGLHFTDRLLKKLKNKGVQLEYVTLHVGLGTFHPVTTKDIADYQIHSEFATIDSRTAKRINTAKKKGGRIIAVGTTSVRTLESFTTKDGTISPGAEWVSIFIYPSYTFKLIDGMITNFHLPESSLLMLVSAFAGMEFSKNCYNEAVKKKYRFYSFGDAMFIY